MRLYGISDAIPAQYDVAVAFARYTLPGILFYGIFVMFQQVLTSRDSFAAPMFAPILNNIVVIATGIAFLYAVGFSRASTRARPDHAVRAGAARHRHAARRHRSKPSFWFRRCAGSASGGGHGSTSAAPGSGRAGGLAAWTFLYVLVNQVALLVIIRIANTVAADGALSDGAEAGYAAYQNAYLLFILPHGIATVSVATALLPRISRHAADNGSTCSGTT